MSDGSVDHAADQLPLEFAADVRLPEAGAIVEITGLDGRQVCLARLDDSQLVAFEPRCPHRGVPLCHGALQDGQLICLEHLWRWQARSGEPLNAAHPPLRTYRVDQQSAQLRLLPS